MSKRMEKVAAWLFGSGGQGGKAMMDRLVVAQSPDHSLFVNVAGNAEKRKEF